jgi:hypothetical protein
MPGAIPPSFLESVEGLFPGIVDELFFCLAFLRFTCKLIPDKLVDLFPERVDQ